MGNSTSTEAGASGQQPGKVPADEEKPLDSCASTSMNLLRRSVTGPRSQKRGQKLSPAEAEAESRAMKTGDVGANRGHSVAGWPLNT